METPEVNRSAGSKRSIVFIDEYVTVHEGKDAEAKWTEIEPRLQDATQGVTEVDRQRWLEAQRYERRTWMELGRRRISDRNEYHRVRFAQYTPLQGRRFVRGIELGSGPFTNLRLILGVCEVEEVHLLDPLLNEYLEHRSCTYKNGLLRYRKNTAPIYIESLREKIVSYVRYPMRNVAARQPVTLHPTTIEDFQTEQTFDLVVMINVLDHCYSAHAVFAKIIQLLAPGGTLVFHEYLYDEPEIRRRAEVIYDAGHPLQVNQTIIHEFLSAHFRPLMVAEYIKEREFKGISIQDHELYYIGVKL